MGVRNTTEGWLQVYYSGPSSGHSPTRLQVTWKIGEGLAQAYLLLDDAEAFARDMLAVIAEAKAKYPEETNDA